jgi:hypothetical protein
VGLPAHLRIKLFYPTWRIAVSPVGLTMEKQRMNPLSKQAATPKGEKMQG